MQVTSLLSREEHDHPGHSCADCGHDHGHEHEHDHSHAVLPLAQTLIGLLFVINSFAVNWMSGFFQGAADPVSAASAMIGAMILGYPILFTAFLDLRRGLLTTNELVALAVTISFGSGPLSGSRRGRLLHAAGPDHRNPHRRRRARLHRIAHQIDSAQSPAHHQTGRGGSGHQAPRRRRCHPRAARATTWRRTA